jgi:signal transduction histidine kinase
LNDHENREHLAKLHQAAERALAEARLAITERGQTDRVPLDSALAELADEFEQRWGCKVVLHLDRVMVDGRTAHELTRTAQEALANAVRHGDPERVVMRLDTDQRRIRLSITDDGVGIDIASPTDEPRYGITSMRNRAARLGGTLHLTRAPKRGTLVAVEVPFR